MSSIITRFTNTTETKRPVRRRSASVSRMERVRADNRIPAIQMKDERDVCTLVCLEISRAMLLAPGVNLRVFLKTASDSRRDINISDTTVLVSVAIMEHIGNKEMADKLLSKSSTLTRFYEKMGLRDAEVRAMMVTMLFAISPGFVEMIEKCIKLAVERSAEAGRISNSDNQVVSAMSMLTMEGSISPSELGKAMSFDTSRELSLAPEARRTSIQRTPIEMISPEDSASAYGKKEEEDYTYKDADLMAYIRRRKSGREPEFGEVFRSAKAPIYVPYRSTVDKSGIGQAEANNQKENVISAMSRILGSQRVKSINHASGEVTYRSPNVMDFIESESLSPTALHEAPDVRSEFNTNYVINSRNAPLPTDITLPRSTYQTRMVEAPVSIRRDSLEDLRNNMF